MNVRSFCQAAIARRRIESSDVVDVWRVLHAERDIPALLRTRDEPSV